jgi:hypothetical protein
MRYWTAIAVLLGLAACTTPADAKPKPRVTTTLVSCADGSVVVAPATCPAPAPIVEPAPAPTPAPAPVVAPEPAPAPTPEPAPVVVATADPVPAAPPTVDPYASPSLAGAAIIPTTDFDWHDALKPGAVPNPQPLSENVGAFRFICKHSHLNYDDATVYPGQPGASHLHDNTGNKKTNAFSNYVSLRTSGGSGCNDMEGADKDPSKADYSGNRTPYLIAAVLNGKGQAIRADYDIIYYKRWPITSTLCTDGKRQKQCVPLPNGLKFVVRRAGTNFKFLALGVGEFTDMRSATAAATTSLSHQMGIRGEAPPCWNGTQLDSPDHMSHLAYEVDSHLGYRKCPDDHPYRIPAFTWDHIVTIAADDDPDLVRLSSDMPGDAPGATAHFDYGPASWDPNIMQIVEDNCFNKKLDCRGGQVGNGLELKGAKQPIYLVNGVYTLLWHNPDRLVPIPPHP